MTVSSTLASPRAPDAAVPRRARRHVGARSARANVHRGTQETQMSRTPRGWSILAVLALIVTLVSPLLATSALAQDEAQVLRVHHASYPDVVDPQKSSTTPEIDILQLVYEGLTRLDTDQNTVPGAAESWEYNDDATQITFHLRPDLTYSDGSPLTAENFRYAVERTCDPRTAGEYQYLLFEVTGCADLAGLAADADGNPKAFTPAEYDKAKAALGVKALDDRTLQIDLTNPAPYFHTIAGLWVFFPVKAEIASNDPDTWWKKAENHIGNGPFTVTGVAEGQEWTFAANDRYWQGRPRLDGIEYRYIDEAAVALEAYRAGDLDIVQLSSDQILEVQADPELTEAFVTYPQAGTQFLAMNLSQPPFNDKKVREAFAYAIDRETLCADLRSGDCLPTRSFIPAGLPGAIETDQYAFDPEAAKQALAESSYGGPEGLPEIKLYYNSDYEERGQQSEWIAGEIRDILGVTLKLAFTHRKRQRISSVERHRIVCADLLASDCQNTDLRQVRQRHHLTGRQRRVVRQVAAGHRASADVRCNGAASRHTFQIGGGRRVGHSLIDGSVVGNDQRRLHRVAWACASQRIKRRTADAIDRHLE